MFNKGFFFLPRFFTTLRHALLSGSGDSRRAIIGRRNGAACAPPLRAIASLHARAQYSG
ncbi:MULTISPECIES: hypothetical protein [unclassified Burkholderia]|uniref:hypothetical protein n=1 Tax=unclassified Burkholderia TaxID=2613784 RepID=UPI000AD91E20|nr:MULTISPECIES: hypothetical protein [unclassified Burkholderia]